MDLPASNVARRQLKDYLERSGMSVAEFASRIEYSAESIYKFLSNTYADIASTDLPLRRAMLEFITAHPLGGGDVAEGRLYETENVRLLRKYFYAALDNGFAYYVDGGPGSQKTFVVQHLIAELNRKEISKNGSGRRAYYVYCRAEMTPRAFLKRIAEACAVSGAGDIDRIIRTLRFEFQKRRVVICLDEAQHLERSIPCLETVRELLDRPPYFGLLFSGSHGLRDMFEKRALVLEQWTSRLRAGKSLPGIQRDEAFDIIRGELGAQPKERVEKLIRGAVTRDLRAGAEHTYISARRLFWSLREIKSRIAGANA
jgi:DNA transposition AAA+ family ATPase